MTESKNKFALVTIDLVQDFFKDKSINEKRSVLVRNVNQLTAVARESNIPVIWVRQEFEPDLSDAYIGLRKTNTKITIKGTPGSQLLSGLITTNKDVDIVKKRFSAFYETKLDSVLMANSITGLIICGVKTHACIRTSVIDAYQRNLNVIIAKDCIADTNRSHSEMSLEYLSKYMARVLGNPEIVELLSISEL